MPFSLNLSAPGTRLLLTWALMSGLTVISIISGDALETQGDTVPLGLVSVIVLMGATLFKCRLLLLDFLELRSSSAGWRRGFIFAIFLIAAMITGAYMLA
ncbi:cytochrome C oxidase subunit IV family protein [Kiloniella laminariae]|uniref:Cytochrome C oxidase subunit IV family protein n=1 Tax=Kiloniella laminariae TaxID=454162 RepID=A0ABT4LPX6_9PROT|nr:cytochrome C oxidase subunit IV family protein [Kiloniella laminariae]MCZ4282945.1 cytochrome C oxidase subunit IV family protein [Kiloniella laminariae]